MGMHEVEGLVEDTVRLFDRGASESRLSLRSLFWNLYDYQCGYDTGVTYFRVMEILVRHRYMYPLPPEKYPDANQYPDYLESVEQSDFDEILVDPSKPWNEETNPSAGGYYWDPIRNAEESTNLGSLATQPLIYYEAGSPLWLKLVANGTLSGRDAEPPEKLHRPQLFHAVVAEALRQENLGLAAEWFQVGIPYELAAADGSDLKLLKRNPLLQDVHQWAGKHELDAIPVYRGFMDQGRQQPEGSFLAWWQAVEKPKAERHATLRVDPAKEEEIYAAADEYARSGRTADVALGGILRFDGAVVRDGIVILEGADPLTIRVLNRELNADKDHVWVHGSPLPLADGATFEPLGDSTASISKMRRVSTAVER